MKQSVSESEHLEIADIKLQKNIKESFTGSNFLQTYLKDPFRGYFFSLQDYCKSKFIQSNNAYHFLMIRTIKRSATFKSYLLTKIFIGRGSFYSYLAFFAIFIPLLISCYVIFNGTNTAQAQVKKITLSNSLIHQAENNTTSSTVHSKLIIQTTSPKTSSSELISMYKVQKGDTLESIATQYNVSPDILVWENKLLSNAIKTGDVLNIIPISGITYTITANDSLQSIAKTYNAAQDQIAAWNLIDPTKPIPVGQKIFIPGGAKIEPAANTPNPITNFGTYVVDSAPSAGCSNISWCYYQTDPRWSAFVMGTRGYKNIYSSISVQNAGCLITDVAMVAAYYGKQVTPATIATNPENFAYGGLFTFSGLGLFDVKPLGGFFGNIDWASINNHIAMKQPVIVGIGYNYHYVVLYQKNANGTYQALDPARGVINFNSIFNPRNVTQAWLYTPMN